MEVETEIQRELNPSHPNFKRWQLARDLSNDRAKFVESILSNELVLKSLNILDFGAGEGNTSRLLSLKNSVVSLEPKPERIKKIQIENSLNPVLADGTYLPFKPETFDVIVMQDVIEHLTSTTNLISELSKLLKTNGIIYLSTPNRFSLLNIISDPHWGIPFLALFKREQIKKYFLKFFRKDDFLRNDIAELYSLNDIFNLFRKNFTLKIHTKHSVNFLLSGGKGLVWSKFHLLLLEVINIVGLSKIIMKLANDDFGIINKYFTPTFYFILRKK